MVSKLKLHVGFHKTGSTSFQQTCARNAKLLESFGVAYPGFRNSVNPAIYNHSIPIFSSFTRDPERYHINRRFGLDVKSTNAGYLEQFQQVFNGDHETLILSGEDVSALKPPELLKMRDFLAARCESIELVALVRPPYSMFVSNLQQVVKTGRSIQSVKAGRISAQVQNLTEVFGDQITFIPFTVACQHQYGVVGTLLEYMGMPNGLIEQIKQVTRNKSASNEAIRLISAINARYPLLTQDGLGRGRYRGDIAALRGLPGERFRISLAEIDASLARLEKDSEWLARHLGDQFSDSQESLGALHEQPDLVGWSQKTLEAVEAGLLKLEPHLTDAALDYLIDLANRFRDVDPDKSRAIEHLASRVESNKGAIQTRLARLQTRHQRQIRKWLERLLPKPVRRRMRRSRPFRT